MANSNANMTLDLINGKILNLFFNGHFYGEWHLSVL